METKLEKVGPKVYFDDAKGAMPTLRMRDGKGKVVEEVNVAEWKADTIVDFLKDKLDDEPLAKVKREQSAGAGGGGGGKGAKSKSKKKKTQKKQKQGDPKVTKGAPYDPKNADEPKGYHRDWGIKYDTIGQGEKSVKAFQRAVKWASASAQDKGAGGAGTGTTEKARANLNLGVAYMRSSKFAEARAAMDAALKLDPAFKDAQDNLAVLVTLAEEDGEDLDVEDA